MPSRQQGGAWGDCPRASNTIAFSYIHCVWEEMLPNWWQLQNKVNMLHSWKHFDIIIVLLYLITIHQKFLWKNFNVAAKVFPYSVISFYLNYAKCNRDIHLDNYKCQSYFSMSLLNICRVWMFFLFQILIFHRLISF